MKAKATFPLLVLTWICGVAIIPSVVLWLVNVQVAVQVFIPQVDLFERVLPTRWFVVAKWLSADLSSISTFVPLLLLSFPFVQGIRMLQLRKRQEVTDVDWEADPYPPHFAFFLVMLGLVGTLYGLMVGLDLSGVSDLAGEPLSQDSIRQSLDRLLGGTATALLSSLVGILGAFAAARPLAWIFRRAAGLHTEARRHSLSETVMHLTGELEALAAASRATTGLLSPATAEALLGKLDRQCESTDLLCRHVEQLQLALQAIVQTLPDQQAVMDAVLAMQPDVSRTAAQTDAMRVALSSLSSSAEEQGDRLRAIAELDAGIATKLDTVAASQQAGGKALVHGFDNVLAELVQGRTAIVQDRDAMRRALALYASAQEGAN